MKKLLICLTVLFSAFLFTNKVSAATGNFDIQPFDKSSSAFTNLELKDSDIQNYISTLGLDSSYDGYLFTIYPGNSYYYRLFVFPKEIAEDGSLMFRGGSASQGYYIGSKTTAYGSTPFTAYYTSYASGKYITTGAAETINSFSDFTLKSSLTSFKNGNGVYFNSNTDSINSPIWYFSNVDIYNEHTNSWLSANAVNKTYNVTFHLNGGIAYDNNFITDDKGSYIIGYKYEDYTSSITSNGLYDYLINQEVSKETMQFVGWYYDEKLTKKVEATDILDSDKDFYAKYQYRNVEDFLNNNTFNSHTFDENYQYAIISLNDQTNRDIYLGLELMSYSFEVYKYNKINLEYHQGASLCLVPIFAKDNKYYYHLDSPLNEDYEVLIIPKEKLNGKYNFLLSSNAYVTYTNDLKNVVIKDESGNDITTDLENSYDYSQDALLNSENDLLEIFKDLINNKDNNVFSYFNQVWNYLKQNRLYIYFMTLIIGALIILIIKTASR